jgi:hypothetical protein
MRRSMAVLAALILALVRRPQPAAKATRLTDHLSAPRRSSIRHRAPATFSASTSDLNGPDAFLDARTAMSQSAIGPPP